MIVTEAAVAAGSLPVTCVFMCNTGFIFGSYPRKHLEKGECDVMFVTTVTAALSLTHMPNCDGNARLS